MLIVDHAGRKAMCALRRLAWGLPAALALVAGCTTMATSAEVPPLEGTAWVLASLAGRPSLIGQAPTAGFEGGRVQGSDGCNRYSAPFTAQASAIKIGPRGPSTQMACAPDVMTQAAAFTSALSSAKTYRVAEGRLQLLDSDGAVLATFTAQSQALAGTSWQATGINNGRGGVAGVVAGSAVTMTFGTDGRVSGSAGCNRFTAGYQASGRSLKITAPATTRRMCPEPGLMEQEQAFVKALESVATMRFEGKRLELRTEADALAVSLMRDGGS